jgi:chromatin remodeling complex protein RSC6
MPAKKQNAKTTKATEPAPAVETPIEQSATKTDQPPATVTATATATPESTFVDKATSFAKKMQEVGALFSGLRTEFRALEKVWAREMKAAQKQGAKRKRKSGNRSPSGFVKPTLISEELSSFLGKPKGSEMARTEVTREINKYIRAHDLQDKDNGRKINPDAKLAKLLKLKKSDELTYFNLQRYMSPHFAKAGATVAPSGQPLPVVAPDATAPTASAL